ncbi:MAG: hybrid sensor histidine kinase/response regulator [Verrucomicrobiota bacterium]
MDPNQPLIPLPEPTSAMVLLVDDQAIIGEAVRRILHAQPGLDFHFCADADLALATARKLVPMVILQDLVMPGADGLELVKAYRQCPELQETPVIVLSTKEEPSIKKAAFEVGANDYIVKLPDPIELLARVRYHASACLARRQLHEALRALRESQGQLLDRNTALEQLNEQKNRLLGMAVHDLRNPLGVILVYSDFLETDAFAVLDADQREFVSTIKSTSEFMLNLINDLLDMSTIESGQLHLDCAPTELVELVRRNVALNRVLAHQKHIELDFEGPATLPPITLDRGKIQQVLNNLIGNAVKYSHPHTRVKITLSVDPQQVTLAVADEGQGIPGADLPKLFQVFGRTSVQATAGEQSTGLGLAIVRKIVEGHGGHIAVHSQVGSGSTFSVTLPLDYPLSRPS